MIVYCPSQLSKNEIVPDPQPHVDDWRRKFYSGGWWHSFELPDGSLIEGVCDLPGLRHRIAQFPIPNDLRGKRVLDIGAWDGWFSFEMEGRGAEVMAIDVFDNPRFREIHSRLSSRVDYRKMDVYDLHPDRTGRFDIVLFFGVLYHLKHPLLALERVCSVCTGLAAVDSFILKGEPRPILEFYETAELGGQTDNWVGPSLSCLIAMCRTAGFARVDFLAELAHSACLACYRDWEPIPASPPEAPELIRAAHHWQDGINFSSASDDYVKVWFHAPHESLSLDDVKPDVGGWGVRPLSVTRIPCGPWQANFKLPPGLTPGWHDVGLRIRDSLRSNSKRIALDLPAILPPGGPTLQITGICDGASWAPGTLDRLSGDTFSLWVAGLPDNADAGNLYVVCNGQLGQIVYVEEAPAPGPRQINVRLPPAVPGGNVEVTVKIGDSRSSTTLLQVG